MTRYFVTNNVYRLENGNVYRWSGLRGGWLQRDAFTPSDLTDGAVIGAVEVSEEEANRRISELLKGGTK